MLKPSVLSTRRPRLLVGQAQKHDSFAQEVFAGLSRSQKAIPSRFFYDQRGSELFELITELPEYYLTRTEQSILGTFADDIVQSFESPCSIVELGSGSSKKTRLLIEAALRSQGAVEYTSIDIARDFLYDSCNRLLDDYSSLEVTAIAAEYYSGLSMLPTTESQRMFLFLGSNLGNFEDAEAIEFLTAVRASLSPNDALLIGIDLAKDRSVIEPAYDDSQSVTAQFNLNLLARINLELGGEFAQDHFFHSAPYVVDRGRVEMRLTSARRQSVRVRDLGCEFQFEEGEYIHTENSRKYSEAEFAEIATLAGFMPCERWYDDRGWFGLFLLRPSE